MENNNSALKKIVYSEPNKSGHGWGIWIQIVVMCSEVKKIT
jgi:hypothetical protein